MSNITQSTTYAVQFLMVLSSDHVSAATGKTVTVNLGKAGASGAAAAGTVSEIDSTNLPGWYKVALTTADTSTVGDLSFHCTASGCDPTDFLNQVVTPSATIASGVATAGAASTITLAAGSSATTDLYKGDFVSIVGGTGAGQARVITGYNGGTLVATVGHAWTTNPDSTSQYIVVANPHPATDSSLNVTAASVTGNVGGNVVGTIGGYASGQDPATLVLDAATSSHTTTGTFGKVVGTNIDATVSSRSTYAGGAVTSGQDPATLVLDATASSHNTASTIGNKINVAGTGSDPWSTALPGAYSSGTAGNIVGNNLNAAVGAVKAKTDTLPGSPAAVGSAMTLDFTQAVPTSNTSQTVGDALNAARAQGFGKWAISGTTLTLYAADGTTAVRTFTLDSSTAPTSRS